MTSRRRLLNLLSTALYQSGWPQWRRRRRHRRGDFRLYILEYHDLCAAGAPEPEGVVAADRFALHLRWLARRFRCVTVQQGVQRLRRAAEENAALNEDLVAITFDDGYASNFEHAWPALQQVVGCEDLEDLELDAIPATIYLATGFLDGEPLWFDVARRTLRALRGHEHRVPGEVQELLRRAFGDWPSGGGEVQRLKYSDPDLRLAVVEQLAALPRALDLNIGAVARPLTWQQVKEMQAAGIEMGAHTVTHPILSRQTAFQQEDEMRRSRRRIADVTGLNPSTFAFPNGSARDYNDASLEALRRLGFEACCTTVRGSNRAGQDPLTLRRLGVGADSIPVLAARLSGIFDQGVRRFLPSTAHTAPTH